jgi:Cu(I)/Ag(I) efflux system protein CusF
MKQLAITIAATALLISVSSYAQQSHQGMGNMKMDGMKMDQPSTASASTNLTTGEVKAIDQDKKMITLKHGPIKSASVQMSPMTMAFPVEDPAMLKNIKIGDTVQFTVENVKGTATVTVLEQKK